jgi:DNA-binding YbaB/EbfC family protein
MFGKIGNLNALLQSALSVSGQMDKLSRDLKERRAVGSAGGGLVEVEINGAHEVLACRIDPKLLEQKDTELLEDLIVAATNQALAKSRQLHVDAMKSMAGGMDLSSLRDMMSKSGAGEQPAGEGPGAGRS